MSDRDREVFRHPGFKFWALVGAVVGELLARGKMRQASRVGVATWIGLIFGTLAKTG